MEKAALFFEDYLYEGPDGKWVFSPTQSPENTPGNTKSQGTFNATMDVAVAKELLHNTIAASRELGRNQDKIARWQQMLDQMPDYMVDERGIIKEWLTPRLANNDSHRHSSQLYPLYDGMPGEIAHSPELRAAFRKSIEFKLDNHWRNNQTGFMSFGLVQLGQAAASLGDAELAHRCLTQLVNRFGTWIRDPFQGNIIPTSRFSSVTQTILQNYDIPAPQLNTFRRNQPFLSNCCPNLNIDNISIKVDQVITSMHKLSGTYVTNDRSRKRYGSSSSPYIPGPIPQAPMAGTKLQATPGTIVRFAEDCTISPTVINHFAYGYNRFGNNNNSYSYLEGQDWATQLGLENVGSHKFPVINWTGYGTFALGNGLLPQMGGVGGAGIGYNGSNIMSDDLTWIKGDMVALGQIGVKIILAGKNADGSNAAFQGQGHAQRILDRPPVDHRQYAGHTRTNRADRGIGLRAGHIDHRAGAEHLRFCFEFGVDFESNDGFIGHANIIQ